MNFGSLFVHKSRVLTFEVLITVLRLENIPLLSGSYYLKYKTRGPTHFRGTSSRAPLRDHNVVWNSDITFVTDIVKQEDGVLAPCELIMTVKQLVTNSRSKSETVGVVKINLSEYAGTKSRTKKFLLQEAKVNSTLKLTITLQQVKGNVAFTIPNAPLESQIDIALMTKGIIFAQNDSDNAVHTITDGERQQGSTDLDTFSTKESLEHAHSKRSLNHLTSLLTLSGPREDINNNQLRLMSSDASFSKPSPLTSISAIPNSHSNINGTAHLEGALHIPRPPVTLPNSDRRPPNDIVNEIFERVMKNSSSVRLGSTASILTSNSSDSHVYPSSTHLHDREVAYGVSPSYSMVSSQNMHMSVNVTTCRHKVHGDTGQHPSSTGSGNVILVESGRIVSPSTTSTTRHSRTMSDGEALRSSRRQSSASSSSAHRHKMAHGREESSSSTKSQQGPY